MSEKLQRIDMSAQQIKLQAREIKHLRAKVERLEGTLQTIMNGYGNKSYFYAYETARRALEADDDR